MAVFVTTPEPIAVGHLREVERRIRASWQQTSTDARRASLAGERQEDASFREEILGATGTTVSELRCTWPRWRQSVAYDGDAQETTVLAGTTFTIAANNHSLTIHTATPEQRRPLEIEYAFLGDPEPIDHGARAIADGQTSDDMATLVLGLLLRHARGVGGYSPSMRAQVLARLASTNRGVGTFTVHLAPAGPGTDQWLDVRGQLLVQANGWPIALELAGSAFDRAASRTQVTTRSGHLELSLRFAYP